ncbi:nucleotide sugar dehydrogenase [Mammaliicoccus sp. I-M36]|uniref:nucleotide sugar dehydrogenase n=1 Tax=Mammaliicoccus sp. I-M36 TaxID=2898695 RepID=UPI001EFA9CF1|nr:nucleotide sugar dehydrogenase [Mammaliicoccus sp. I-M36]
MSDLKSKIQELDITVSVLGLGYVGLNIALALAKKHIKVYGIDTNEMLINSLFDYNYKNNGSLKVSTRFNNISKSDVIIICVPTPLKNNIEPDLSFIENTVIQIKKYVRKNTLIILESTTYPGCTEELIQEKLLDINFVAGHDYFLCFSPERIDPGNKKYHLQNTPKIVGGFTPKCSKLGETFYQIICEKVKVVSSIQVAEFSKLLENTFRNINIAFINEMSIMCEELGINIWESIDAANTKPFGFLPFYPSIGVGGHCIPLDPMYLQWKGKNYNCISEFINLSHKLNNSMPWHIYKKIENILISNNKTIHNSKILIVGITYKDNVPDTRESPSLKLLEILVKCGVSVDYFDPLIPSISLKQFGLFHSIIYDKSKIEEYDCVVLTTYQNVINYKELSKIDTFILDTKNFLKDFKNQNIHILGDGSHS